MKIITSINNYKAAEYPSVRDALAKAYIVEVTKRKDGIFIVCEQCDNYFSAELTPEQLKAWGEELIAMSGLLATQK